MRPFITGKVAGFFVFVILFSPELLALPGDQDENPEYWVKQLKDPDPKIRCEAADVLRYLGDRAAVALPALLEAFKDSDPEVRVKVAEALVMVDGLSPAVRTAYLAALADPSPQVRSKVLAELHLMGKLFVDLSQSLPQIIAMLKDPDEDVRWWATVCLGGIHVDAKSVQGALIEALRDQRSVRGEAAEALGLLRPPATDAVPRLTELLNDADEGVRWKAALALQRITRGHPQAVSVLVDIARKSRANPARDPWDAFGRDPTGNLAVKQSISNLQQAEGLRTLRLLGPAAADAAPDLIAVVLQDSSKNEDEIRYLLPDIGPAAVELLVQALDDADPAVRRRAAEMLGEFGWEAAPAIPVLLVKLRRKEIDAGAAVATLGKIGTPAEKLLPLALPLLDDPDDRVCSAAIGSIRELGPAARDAVPALARKLKDGSDKVRRDAAHALTEIGPAAAEAVPALCAVLDSAETRSAVAEALGRIGPSAHPAVSALTKLARGSERDCWEPIVALGRIGPDAKDSVPVLIEALKRKEYPVRLRAADALGGIGPGAVDALPALRIALQDDVPMVRIEAAIALSKITQDAAALVQMLQDHNPGIRAEAVKFLGDLQANAADTVSLRKALGDPAPRVRAAAARALGKLKCAAAVPDLETALDDRFPEVRVQAAGAVIKLGQGQDREYAVLFEELNSPRDDFSRTRVAAVLGEAGDKAQPAVPQLVAALDHDLANVRKAIFESLKNIDPATAEAVQTKRSQFRPKPPPDVIVDHSQERREPDEERRARPEPPPAFPWQTGTIVAVVIVLAVIVWRSYRRS